MHFTEDSDDIGGSTNAHLAFGERHVLALAHILELLRVFFHRKARDPLLCRDLEYVELAELFNILYIENREKKRLV